MNNEAPEQPRNTLGKPLFPESVVMVACDQCSVAMAWPLSCGHDYAQIHTQVYRRLDPPAAPKCPTCKSDDKDIRNLGCNGSYGILHDNCGTEPCPDAWHAPAPSDERDEALAQMDWQQVALNGGPPCFAQLGDEQGWYCGRAERWAGHDGEHKFVSLEDLLATVRAEGDQNVALMRSACIEAVRSLRHKSEPDDSRWNAALYHAETKLEAVTIQEQKS